MDYWDKEADEGHGDNRRLKGNRIGPFVVPADQIVTVIPKGTLIALDTDPTPLTTTPLTGRKWIQFKNEDLVDVYLCDSVGNIFERLEPGQKTERYIADDTVDFYGKVASGTATIGIRVKEGK